MFGHGFVPRLKTLNASGFFEAMAPAGLFDTPRSQLVLPWTVVHGPDALKNAALCTQLTAHGVRYLVDNEAWRFRDDRYLQSPKWSAQPYTPERRCDDTRRWVDVVVALDLRAQALSQPDCYGVPGWFARHRGEDVRHLNSWAMACTQRIVGNDVPVKPLVQFVGLRTDDPGGARQQIVELHRGAAAAYVHVSHVRASDSLLRLGHVFDLLSAVEEHGMPVLAARCGSLGVAFRAMGVAATESGLADAESFDYAEQLQAQVSRSPVATGSRGRPGGARVYWPAIGMTLAGPVSARITDIPRAAQLLACPLQCHRFRPLSSTTGHRAAEHSLRSRVDEAHQIAGLPLSMRLDRAFHLTTDRRDRLRALNSILRSAGEPPLSEDQLTTQLALLTDRSVRSGVA